MVLLGEGELGIGNVVFGGFLDFFSSSIGMFRVFLMVFCVGVVK